MPETSEIYHWARLTPAINEIKSPNQFVTRLLYGRQIPQPTEKVELSVYSGGREAAPFVKVNAEALMVEGVNETFHTVEAPNIRIKRPLRPHDLLTTRRPGTLIFQNTGGIARAIREHIALNQARLGDLITNSTEYLACMSLTGTVTYQVLDEDAFTITYPRAAGHTVDISGGTAWSAATPQMEIDFLTAKRLIANAVGLNTTDCIMSQTAAVQFLKNAKGDANFFDANNLNIGTVSFANQFREDGALLLGVYSGVRCWEYARQVTVDGTATNLIRDKYVEFVAALPGAQWTMYYGAIPDMKALAGRMFVGKRFSKSWDVEDPSVRWLLAASRPLPCPRRPDASVSMKVLA